MSGSVKSDISVRVKEVDVQIGELSERTGASVRSLRYYEQQGLLASSRRPNGYREYPANAVATVETIRALLDIGMSTALVAEALPCTVGEKSEAACPALLSQIAQLRDDIRSKASRLTAIDSSLSTYLEVNA
jgi:DNA-binding transcriptional MerR regulator